MEKIKIAIIGYGGIARLHSAAYRNLIDMVYPIEIVAVCEKDVSRITKHLDFNLGADDTPLPDSVHIYSDADEMIEKEGFDIADICLPTFLHKDFSIKLLRAGKHVICEKPMALSSTDCEEMIAAARAAGRRFMIGHVLRFSPEYIYLKECINDSRFGALDNLYMDRHSVYPTWGAGNVFADNSKTGGCTLDTHIHDIDMACCLLGQPRAVSAVEFNKPPMYQVVTTNLFYKTATVVASCSWDSSYDTVFRAGYRARFERASVVCEGGCVKVIPNGAEPFEPKLASESGTERELRYMIDGVLSGETLDPFNPPEASAYSVSLIEKIRKSAGLGGEKLLI